jgi:glycosyltransferase involved in cell wall biosynthesis
MVLRFRIRPFTRNPPCAVYYPPPASANPYPNPCNTNGPENIHTSSGISRGDKQPKSVKVAHLRLASGISCDHLGIRRSRLMAGPANQRIEEPPMEKVSIVLPTYNGARYLREAVDSCLNQTFSSLELIVVVDGSTDNTDEILKTYGDSIRIVRNQHNLGLAKSLNIGFAEASGELFSWTSDDNLFMPEAIEAMVGYLENHPACNMVCTDLLMIDHEGRTVSYDQKAWACFLYKAEAARQLLPYRPEYELVEDVDFFIRLDHYFGPIERIPRPYYKYRTHAQSLSSLRVKERQMRSLKLHYELITQGVEKGSLEDLFRDKLDTSALYKDFHTMEAIVKFARDRNLPFVEEIVARKRFLTSNFGWFLNRIMIAIKSQIGKIYCKLKLLKYRWVH